MHVLVQGQEYYAYTGGKRFDPSLPALVLVHGAGNDHSVWSQQSRYLAHHGHAVIAVDLPGHGRSAGPALASVPELATWLIALLDALGVRRAAIAGHSLGSLIALETAATFPERVTRLALLGSAVPMTVSDTLLNAARDHPEAAYRMIVGWSLSYARQLGGNAVPGMWLAGGMLRLMERTPAGVLFTDLAACNDYQTGLAAAARVTCPALLIVGGRDLMAPPKAAQALMNALPKARLLTLPEIGHGMMGEAPEAVLEALKGCPLP